MKTIILDQDCFFKKQLKKILDDLFPELTVVATSTSIVEGIKLIKQEKIDLVFSETNFSDGSCFDFIDCLPEIDFPVILISNDKNHAFKAFKYRNIIDFLVKPVRYDELKTAIKIADCHKKNGISFEHIKNNYLKKTESSLCGKIPFKTSKGIEYISFMDIIRIEAMRSYCKVFFKNNKSLLLSKCLGKIERSLNSDLFYRAHKSHLVNLRHVEEYKFNGNLTIKLTDNSFIPLARNKKKDFSQKITVVMTDL